VKRIGFIINSRVPELASLRKGMPPHALLTGWDDAGSPMSFMRFRWVAEALRQVDSDCRYELYRPGRTYAAVVFLKSMGSHCLALARRLRAKGTVVIFEANVDYYTRFDGPARLDVMAPSAAQRADAISMTALAHGVIGSSRHLTEVCRAFNPNATWVPDNVDWRLRPATIQREAVREGRLQVWWSGMAAKLFEFLAADDAFLALADRIHLQLVTDDVEEARTRWPVEVRERFEGLLARVPHTVHRFRDIPHLLDLYATGGVIVSPRFLDVPYNLSHTEWKISLGMACDLPAIASPVPSYIDAAELSGPGAVTIARTTADWVRALERFLADESTLREAGRAASEAVRGHYETSVVASRHSAWIAEVCARVKG
jgi:glycosyltransferase involved in cell wall biosynthesis